jgi:hypothetical protein
MNNKNKKASIFWDDEIFDLEDFFMYAKSLGYNNIIYLTNIEGDMFEIWATSTNELFALIKKFSSMQFFVRIQSIENAILYGFDDYFLNN